MKTILLILLIFNIKPAFSIERQKSFYKPINCKIINLILNDSLLTKVSAQIRSESDCEDNFVLQNVEPKSNYIYNAGNSIVTENDYQVSVQNGDIKMKAGGFIVLTPNTHIKKGSIYLGKIQPCSSCELDFSFSKFFTPNGDSYNDFWKIDWFDSSRFSPVSIYDRYGKLIKVLMRPNDFWNGSYNSSLMQSSDYWFEFEYKDCNGKRKIYKSHFSLKR